tara:strand:+ start:18406 stop:19110 length:705 start_codon:yes stop_codon:yes gene_type:complete
MTKNNKRPDGLTLPRGSQTGPNCGVTAMAIASGISFDASWDLLKKVCSGVRFSDCGRAWNSTKFTGGTFDRERAIAYKKIGLKTTEIKLDKIKKRLKVKNLTITQFVKWGSKKGATYIITAGNHVQVLKDGWLIDQSGPTTVDKFWNRNSYIKLAREIVKMRKASSTSKYAGKRLYKVHEGYHNHRKTGTFGYHSMQIIIDYPGISYEDYITKGGRPNDLAWDIERHHVVARGN